MNYTLGRTIFVTEKQSLAFIVNQQPRPQGAFYDFGNFIGLWAFLNKMKQENEESLRFDKTAPKKNF